MFISALYNVTIERELSSKPIIKKAVTYMKRKNYKKKLLGLLTAAAALASAAVSCTNNNINSAVTDEPDTSASETLAAEALSEKKTSMSELFSARDLDPSYDSIDAEIRLEGDSTSVDGKGVTADGSVITITAEGIYRVTGNLSNGQLIVDAPKAKVQLVLDNADISCKDSSAIYIKDADKTFITLAKNSKNTVSDGSAYELPEGEDEPDAAIFSKDSLTINGWGELTVNGNYSCGIRSKDDIVVTGGIINVTAAENGIKAKDYFAAAGGSVNVTSGGDGIKATNSEDSSLGFVYVEGGSFDISSGEDGIQAETSFVAAGGSFNILSGGGSDNSTKTHNDGFGGMGGGFGGGRGGFGGFGENFEPGGFDPGSFDRGAPAPGGAAPEAPEQGDFDPGQFRHGGFDPGSGEMPSFGGENGAPPDIPSGADTDTSDSSVSTKGIKAGTELIISGGEFDIDSADDALHSNARLDISGGSITARSGDDGIHADEEINISGGKVAVAESYEGIESADINISGGTVEIKSSDDGLNASDGSSQGGMGRYSSATLTISGGTVYVDAEGDGLDSNGDILISGGIVLVDGPVSGGNGALDSNGEITVTGGLLIAAGSSGMAEAPGSSSSQYTVSAAFDSSYSGGTLVTLLGSDGKEILSFAPSKTFSHIVISSPGMEKGGTYTLCTGGSSGSAREYGLYESGGYKNDGDEAASFTADDVVTYVGSQSMMGGGMGKGGRGGFGRQQPVL